MARRHPVGLKTDLTVTHSEIARLRAERDQLQATARRQLGQRFDRTISLKAPLWASSGQQRGTNFLHGGRSPTSGFADRADAGADRNEGDDDED